ncbi:hypothetical protein K437DRAFT_20721 [Tilletiaria anomala UBC 951]|uniref:Uncharacterized protein n=1 Tax=Tilletiaria anomala (strain ATCC 24038 / CBS 436.72 / UBC 951) TaxID=1037660 RepID=A0A066VAM9_TILAU|nr:uncharacterized protein K437DRAFT_20721 [Tilletiaria anomala UBC 951]KDN38797.1 hypothetical protein K437DRAFT_20721 [Tilletiaria anomala UBC 951]
MASLHAASSTQALRRTCSAAPSISMAHLAYAPLGSVRTISTHQGRPGRQPLPPSRAAGNGAKLLYAAAPFSFWSWITGSQKGSEADTLASSELAKAGATSSSEQGELPSKSSALLYPVSAMSQRSSNSVTLVFLNINAPKANPSVGVASSTKWQSWISYFREMGYDCLDVNAVSPSGSHQALATELEQQIRLHMFNRGPVLFVRGSTSAKVAAAQLAGFSRPGGQAEFAAAVVLVPGEEGMQAFQAIDQGVREKLAVLIVNDGKGSTQQGGEKWKVLQVGNSRDAESGKTVQEVEMWLMANGF